MSVNEAVGKAIDLFSEDEAHELAKVIPYAKTILKGWKAAKKFRARRFLLALSKEFAKNGADAQQRLDRILESTEGQELLGEYMDAMLATSSKVVGACLAVLYADTEHVAYPVTFKRYAVASLQAMTDDLAAVYLEILQHEKRPAGHGISHAAWGGDMSDWPVCGSLLPSLATRSGAIAELVRRGLLLPIEWTGIGYGPTVIAFCYPEHSESVLQLLTDGAALSESVNSDIA